MSSKYQLDFERDAEKSIERMVKRLDDTFKKKLEETLAQLVENPFGPLELQARFRFKKIAADLWSARIAYHYRIVYRVSDLVVTVVAVTSREDAYK